MRDDDIAPYDLDLQRCIRENICFGCLEPLDDDNRSFTNPGLCCSCAEVENEEDDTLALL